MPPFNMFGWDFRDSHRLFEKIASMDDEAIKRAIEGTGISKYVILSTCNRFEVYYEGSSTIGPFPFEPQRRLSHKEAVRHLFLVSSGLESLSLGENEILGQIKEAYDKALKSGRISGPMSGIMMKAISCGKSVRNKTGISAGRVSIPSYCGQVIYSSFRGNGKRIAIIGTGKMSMDILKYTLEGKPSAIIVYGRRKEGLDQIKNKFPRVECRILGDIKGVLNDSDIIIFATTSKSPLMFAEDFEDIRGRKAILDVSVPTNVDSSVDSMDVVRVMRLGDIEPVIRENMEWKKKLVGQAEMIVEEQAETMMKKLMELESDNLIAEIYNFSMRVGNEESFEFKRALDNGQDLDTALEGLVNSIIKKLLHPQTAVIRNMIRSGQASQFLDSIRSYYAETKEISASVYSESEDQEDHRNRRARIRQ